MEEDTEIKKIALKNAMEHGGRAEDGAILSKVIGADKSVLKDLKTLRAKVKEMVNYVNGLSDAQRAEEAEELGVNIATSAKAEPKAELKDLPNVKGKVVLRLPPEPSGFMHLGHAISGMINFLYKEKYNGKLWLRFEDTNPVRGYQNFIDDFKSGYSWLGIKWDEEKFITDDMIKIYDYAEKLLKEGKLYACSCPEEDIKKNRAGGTQCACRNRPVDENLELFDLAKRGKKEPKSMVIRLVGDMKSNNYRFRDPNMFRIVRTDYKPFHLWPTYYFANVVEDYLCGVTHILRSNEFDPFVQSYLRKLLEFYEPITVQFSRYNFKGVPFSKRVQRRLISEGKIKDYNDLRLPTIKAIRRRGIQPEAIKEFTLRVGYSGSKHEYTWDLLLTLNRRLIDERARRMFFVPDPIRLEVSGPNPGEVRLLNHPSSDRGSRILKVSNVFFVDRNDFSEINGGDIIRLKDLFSIKVNKKEDNALKAEVYSEKRVGAEKIIQWVSSDNTTIKVQVIGELLNPDKTFNENSLMVKEGFAEKTVELLNEGDIIQFERFGFCRLDNKAGMEFIFISR